MKVHLLALNCNGLALDRNRSTLIALIKHKNADLVLLQETHIHTVIQKKQISKQWGATIIWGDANGPHDGGTAILINPKFKGTISSSSSFFDGRVTKVSVVLDHENFDIFSIYAPANYRTRPQFFKDLYDIILQSNNPILAGDFNCISNPNLDRISSTPYINRCMAGIDALTEITSQFNLIDAYRHTHPLGTDMSCTTSRTINNTQKISQSRIDRFYIPKTYHSLIKHVQYTSCIYSDHSFLALTLNLPNVTKLGPGYWKCNQIILSDPHFILDFQSLWDRVSSVDDRSPEWWDGAKMEFRSLIQAHSIRLSTIKKFKIHELENIINSNTARHSTKTKAKADLHNLLSDDLEAAKIRSRSQRLDFEETPSKYFLHLEKQQQQKKLISRLESANGDVTRSEDIISTCRDFYSNLLSAEPVEQPVIDYFLEGLPSLTPEQQLLCEGPITKAECLHALKHMRSDRSPGIDGLTKEFYLSVFHLIGDDFAKMANACYLSGHLSDTQRHGLITLLPKTDLPSCQLTNWRPISLLCVDYKIMSKVICNRLKLVSGFIVSKDQTCAVPGRSILDNLHLLRNSIDYINVKNIPAAVISLDQAKAFDRVSHDYLFQVLEKFGFGPSFLKWISLFYNDVSSSVYVNRFISEPFPVTRSVRQGCSLSPALYILAAEPFANKVRQDSHIEGLRLPGSADSHVISQYADDNTFILTCPLSIFKLFCLADLFSRASGSLLNRRKCFAIGLGTWKDHPPECPGLVWKPGAKIYGVYFGTDDDALNSWKPVLQKIERRFIKHRSRNFTLRGAAVFLNSMVLSSLWYVGQIYPIPKHYIPRFNKLFFSLIWGNNKPELLWRDTLHLEPSEGGLGLSHYQLKLKAFYVLHLFGFLKGTEAKWAHFTAYFVGLQLRDFCPQIFSPSTPHSEVPTPFYHVALQEFRQIQAYLDLNSSYNTKSIYNKLLSNQNYVVKVQSKFPDIDFNTVWPFITHKFFDHYIRNFNYKIVHQILPVASMLFRRNIVHSTNCIHCSQPETIEHLLIECPTVEPVWISMLPILNKVTSVETTIDRNFLLFHLSDTLPSTDKPINLLIFSYIKYALWLARNAAIFDNIPFNANSVSAGIKHNIRQRISADYNRNFRLFLKTWSHCPNLVEFTGDKLKFLF
jgi:exonuclease III